MDPNSTQPELICSKLGNQGHGRSGSDLDIPRSELTSTIDDYTPIREEAIQQECLATIERLRCVNNLVPPVSSLPTETLMHIFSFLLPNYSRFPDLPERPYRHMNAAQVCSRWRNITLQHFLSIHLGHPERVDFFLQCSEGALVDIIGRCRLTTRMPRAAGGLEDYLITKDGAISLPLMTKSAELVRKQLHRVKTLMLALPKRVFEDTFRDIENGVISAPALRKIVLVNKNNTRLPDIFSPHSFPALRHIEVSLFSFTWYPSFYQFTTLETIVIRSEHGYGSPGCLIPGLIKVLSNNPGLKVLKIRDDSCLERYSTSRHETLPSVSLLNLRELVADLDLGCLHLFLGRCTLPSSATANICTPMKDYALGTFSPTALKSMISHLAQKFFDMTGLELIIQNIEGDPDFGRFSRRACEVTFRICYSAHTQSHVAFDDPDFVERDTFKFVIPFSEGWDKTIRDALSPLPLSGVKYLKLALRTSTAHWQDFVGLADIIANVTRRCCPEGIQILSLDGSALFLVPLISASLCSYKGITSNPQPAESYYKPSTPSLLRSLRALIISRVDNSSSHNWDARMPDYGSVFDTIHSQVKENRETGTCSRLSKLVLQYCDIQKDNLYELIDSVADLVHQRGRFTTDPYPSPAILRDTLSQKLKAKLDPFANPCQHAMTWEESIPYKRVTLNFCGPSGIQVERAVLG